MLSTRGTGIRIATQDIYYSGTFFPLNDRGFDPDKNSAILRFFPME